jgi:hypothetical protein
VAFEQPLDLIPGSGDRNLGVDGVERFVHGHRPGQGKGEPRQAVVGLWDCLSWSCRLPRVAVAGGMVRPSCLSVQREHFVLRHADADRSSSQTLLVLAQRSGVPSIDTVL